MIKRFWAMVPHFWVMVALAIGMVVMLVFIVDALRFNSGSKTVTGQAKTIQAMKDFSGERPSSDDAQDSLVTYTFVVNGKTYDGQDSLSVRPDEMNVTVYYMPADPARSRLSPANAILPIIILIVLLAATAVLVPKWLVHRRAQAAHAAAWKPAPGHEGKIFIPRPKAR